MTTSVAVFKDTFHRLDAHSLHLLDELYNDRVVFQDPFRRIEGLPALRHYCGALYRDTISSSVVFEEECIGQDAAMLSWTLSFRHTRLNHGALIQVPGVSHLRYRDKVHYHRDYFDGGALLYEHVPLLGSLVKAVKRRM